MWDSNQDILRLAKSKKHLLPKDFDYKTYLSLNPDLNKLKTKKAAINHFLLMGRHENRSYKPYKLIDVDKDFDENFYLSEYPDVKEYYKNSIFIPLKEKLFHHYINYGKYEGRFKNQKEQESLFVDVDQIIDTSQYEIELINPSNNLEAVCLLLSDKEIIDGRFDKFLDNLIQNTKISSISKNIDFNILINTKYDKINIKSINTIFKKINIISLDLQKNEDIYLGKPDNVTKLPKYGLKSGPNIMFFKTIDYCYKYNTSLLLETDCIFSYDWLTKIYNYTKYSNGFLISGATYDGDVFAKAGSAMLTHINGGTALYATNNPILIQLIKILGVFMINQIKINTPGLAYDYGLKLLIDNKLNGSEPESQSRKFWQFINRNYLPNKLVFNCSTSVDAHINTEDMFKKYQFAILHKK